MPDQEIIEAPAPRAGVVGEGLERLVPQDMAQLAWMAKTLASSGMFLKSLAQGRTAPLNAAETFVVMQEGIGLGLSPLQALREIAVVESRGRLTTIPSARVVSGRIQADPRLESWEATGDATSFTVKAKRKGRPAIEVTVSVEEFSQAEVNRHLEHLEDWLFARAVRRLARRGFSDMLLGIYVGGEPEVVDAVTVNVAALERDAGTDGVYGRHDDGGSWILCGGPNGGAYLRCERCGATSPPPQEIRDVMRGRAEEYRIEAPAPTQSPTQPPLEEGERPITPADLEGVATAVPEAPEGLPPIGNPVPGVPHPIDVPDIDPERGEEVMPDPDAMASRPDATAPPAETAQEAGGVLDRNDAIARLMERIGEMRHGPAEVKAELKNALAQMGWQERTPLGGWVVAQTDEVVLDLAVKLGTA